MAQDIKVIVTSLLFGQTVQNVLHFHDSNATFLPVDIGVTVKSLWVDKWRAVQAPDVKYVNFLISNLDDPTAAPQSITLNADGTGSSAAQSPAFLSLVLKITTAVAGRHGRGRTYIAGISVGALSLGLWTSGFLTSMEAFMADLRSAFVTGGSHLTIGVRPKVAGVFGAVHPATNLQLRTVPGVQRRRNIGVGI